MTDVIKAPKEGLFGRDGKITNAGHRFLMGIEKLSANAAATEATVAVLADQAPGARPIAGGFRGLRIAVESDFIAHVTADAITLEDDSGEILRVTTLDVSPGTDRQGADGLDAGDALPSTWYSAWVIASDASSVAGLLSTSTTSPTMPSGYTFKARIGWVRTDAAALLMRTLQYGRTAQYVVGSNPAATPFVANGAAGSGTYQSPTLASASLANYVPTTAMSANMAITNFYHNATAVTDVLVAPNTAWGGANKGPTGTASNAWPIGTDNNTAVGASAWLVLEAQSVAWFSAGAGGGLACLGWQDNI